MPHPPKTRRYCVVCNRMTDFIYNRTIGHSDCKECGARFGKKEDPKLKPKPKICKIGESCDKFKIGDKVKKVKGYLFPSTIRSVFKNSKGETRVVAELDYYGLLHIFNEKQLEKIL